MIIYDYLSPMEPVVALFPGVITNFYMRYCGRLRRVGGVHTV